VLLVCESRAFFSLYQTLSAAGTAAVQLDRRLLSSTAAAAARTPKAAATTAAGGAKSSSESTAAAATAAGWEAAVQAALANASCVLVTPEQLLNPLLPLQHFDALIDYISSDRRKEDQLTGSTATEGSTGLNHSGLHAAGGDSSSRFVASADAAAEPGGNTDSSSSRSEAVAKQFAGWHYVLTVVEPDLEAAAAAAAAATAIPAAAAAAAPAAVQLQHPPGTAAAALHTQPSIAPRPLDHSGAAVAAARSNASAAAAPAAEQPGKPKGPPELPLLLNCSPGSVIRQRRSLYESLLQLEGQGYCLVERNLTATAAAGTGSGSGGSSTSSVVDVVLSPAACLCVWHPGKLPQVIVTISCFTLLDNLLFFAMHGCWYCCTAVLAHSHHSLPLSRSPGSVPDCYGSQALFSTSKKTMSRLCVWHPGRLPQVPDLLTLLEMVSPCVLHCTATGEQRCM
jgi:hypothetical protein